MKKLVRLVILGAILCPIISIAISCSEEADCSMTARPMVNCILYRVDPETQYVENDTLDSLTVTAYGTDSIIINNQKKMIPCSVYLEGEYGESDICIGVPVILGKNGIEKIVELELTEDEKAKFAASAAAVHKTNAALKEVGAL